MFASDPGEIDTRPIFELALQESKRVVFPVVEGKMLEFRQVRRWKELSPGYRGILEPQFGPEIHVDDIDVLIVPGTAFDRRGHRLGRGGGFYDRLLSNAHKLFSVGVGFHAQLLEEVPVEDHDCTVCAVVTDKAVFYV